MQTRLFLAIAAGSLLLFTSLLPLTAQQITGTLTGLVADQSGAAIPGAKVIGKNQGSGDVRQTVTNNDGYFTIASLPAGTYSIAIEASGFSKWQQNDLALNAGDRRTLADIVLAVG